MQLGCCTAAAPHLALLHANPFRLPAADVHQTLHCPLILSCNTPHLVWSVCEIRLCWWTSLRMSAISC